MEATTQNFSNSQESHYLAMSQFQSNNLSGGVEGMNATDYSMYYDYTNIDYPGDIKQPTLIELVLKVSLYSVIILGALIGNVLIIIVVMKNKKMQTTTNFFIVNLAVADILVTLCCSWVFLVNNLTEGWILGEFFCKVNSFAQVFSTKDFILLGVKKRQYVGIDIIQPTLIELILKVSLYSVVILGALIGNVLIIIVVMKNKKMQTTTNFFIVNLAVADILVTLCCSWVFLVNNLTEGWILGEFFCKINSFAQVTALVASIFSLVLIAFDRFFGIVYAMEAHIIERKASHSIAVIWVCAFAAAIPMLIVRQTEQVTWSNHLEIWCDDDWPGVMVTDHVTGMVVKHYPSRKAYYIIITLVLYFVPMVFMSLLYSLIMWTVWFAQVPGERISNKDIQIQRRVKRKVVTMLVIILATFGVCWLPLQIMLLYSELKPQSVQLPDWYHSFEFFAYTLAFTNSALNPLIYAGFNDKFRRGFRALFGCYERKLYAAISRVDSMYNSSTNMTKV